MKHRHGLSGTRLYKIWSNMKRRCYNPKDTNYDRYGGRGITVCDEWKDSFMSFYNWAMANGYQDELTIDRKNNDGNYEPSNCRWATVKEQENNRGNYNIHVTYQGKTQTLMQWAEELGLPFATLRYRIVDSKWPVEDAFSIGIGEIAANPKGTPPEPTEKERERRRRQYQKDHDSRAEYIEKQTEMTEKSMITLKKIMSENPNISNRKAAKLMDISEGYVRKLKKRIKETT